MSSEEPERLCGGNMGDVFRQDDRVNRPSGAWTPAVHRLLSHLNNAGVRGVPKPLAIINNHREVITYVEGTVPNYPMPEWVWSETALMSSTRLLRQVHDVTAGLSLEGPWRSPVREPVEVICHNDFAPYNLVFDDEQVVGVIDWDFASPGPRLWDIAYLAYRIVPLSSGDRRDGFTDEDRRRRLQLLITAYGSDADEAEVLAMLGDRLLALASFTEDTAERLDMPQLRDHARLYRFDAAQLLAT